MDYLAVFSSRSDALKVYYMLKEKKIACSVVNTPSYLKMGCGISIVFASFLRDKVAIVIAKAKVSTFVGFYAR